MTYDLKKYLSKMCKKTKKTKLAFPINFVRLLKRFLIIYTIIYIYILYTRYDNLEILSIFVVTRNKSGHTD